MMYRFFTFVLALTACCYAANAQSTKGYLLLAIKPSDAVVRLDTLNVSGIKSHIQLDTGNYILKAWAPGYSLFTDTVTITSKSPLVYRARLTYSEPYMQYRKEKKSYQKHMALTRYIPWAVTAFVTIYFPLQYISQSNAADDYYNDALYYKDVYETSTDAGLILASKERYYLAKADYESALEKSNKAATAALVAIPTAMAISTWLYFYSEKFEKPLFEETPLLSNVSISLMPPVATKTTFAGIHIRF